MNKQYSLQGTKIIMRRLFKYDTEEIIKCFEAYNQLFFSPVTPDFINSVLLEGEFWGAFVNNDIVACSYIYPFDCALSQKTERYSQLTDFISSPSEYMMLGYTGFHKINTEQNFPLDDITSVCSNIYKAFMNTAEMQAFRHGKKCVLHCMPHKLLPVLSPVFECGYELLKLRGLEKLVVHYIFVKTVYPVCSTPSHQKGESHCVAQNNTKALSRFLEDGYRAYDAFKDNNNTVLLLKHQ